MTLIENVMEKVKSGLLIFYNKGDYIYCEDIKTGKRIIVGRIK